MSDIDTTVDGRAVDLSIEDSNAAQQAQYYLDNDTTDVVDGSLTLANYEVSDDYRNSYSSAYSGSAGPYTPPTFSYFTAVNSAPATIIGNGSFQFDPDPFEDSHLGTTTTYGVLAGQGATYYAGLSGTSVIIAGDDTASAIINDNPYGNLIAYTGTGGNALVGLGTVNVFNTGDGGSDAVLFDAGQTPLQLNVLNSQGQDNVTINGPSSDGDQFNFVTALGDGADSVFLGNGASLTFINQSTDLSTITTTDGSTVLIGGTGSTLVQAGLGEQTFQFLDQPGLNGGFTEIRNFSNEDTIVLSSGDTYTATAAATGSGTVLTTGSGSRIMLDGVYDPSSLAGHVVLA